MIDVDPETDGRPWTLSVRRPLWSQSGTAYAESGGSTLSSDSSGPDVFRFTRQWRRGDRVVMDLHADARLLQADRRIDAYRGSAAIERGPIVYCLEAADLPAGVALDEIVLPRTLETTPEPMAGLVGTTGLRLAALQVPLPAACETPYQLAGSDAPSRVSGISACAIPYHAWGNREAGAMRVWLPLADR